MGCSENEFSHSLMNGARVGRCERTRSITIFNGQGRRAVSSASRHIAKKAQANGHRNGRSNGNNGSAHCRKGISAGGPFFTVQVPTHRGCFRFSGGLRRLRKFESAAEESAPHHFRAGFWVDNSLAGRGFSHRQDRHKQRFCFLQTERRAREIRRECCLSRM